MSAAAKYQRLEDQILWYDTKSSKAQQTFKLLRFSQLLVAAAIPVASVYEPNDALIPGILGALILVLEGLQELGSYQRNWRSYRKTCEALRHEKYLFEGGAGAYRGKEPEERQIALIERVESLISKEHTNWAEHLEKTQSSK